MRFMSTKVASGLTLNQQQTPKKNDLLYLSLGVPDICLQGKPVYFEFVLKSKISLLSD